MKLRFIWIGKTKEPNLCALVKDYLNRISHYAKYELQELREVRSSSQAAVTEGEARAILAALAPDSYTVALDERGQQWSSRELSLAVEKWRAQSVREVAFVIGGSGGLAEAVRARADHVWSLSKLTFTHEMARVLLLEQLYRAYTIIHGHPYQK